MRWRIVAAIVCGLLAISVDFYSQIMSICADLLFVTGIFVFLFPLLKQAAKEPAA